MAGGKRKFTNRFRISDRRARARAGNDLCRADQERFRALSAERKVARVSKPHRRQRMGSAHQRSAAAELLCERAALRDVSRFARALRHLLRNTMLPGVLLG